MKKISVVVFCFLASYCSLCFSEKKMIDCLSAGKALVYYFDFKIERITGLHEGEMESYTSYCLSKDDFNKIFIVKPNETDSMQYNKLNVRAKIIFKEEVYYIDRNGVVRGPNGYGKIDKKEFSKYLVQR